MNFVKFLFVLVVLFVAASFGAKNMGAVEITYFLGDRTLAPPVFFVVLSAVALGALVAWAYFGVSHVRLRRQARHQQREIADLQRRLARMTEIVDRTPAIPPPVKQPTSPLASPSDDDLSRIAELDLL